MVFSSEPADGSQPPDIQPPIFNLRGELVSHPDTIHMSDKSLIV